MKIKALFGCIAAAVALQGCTGPKQEACWAPETKQTVTSLARAVVLEQIESLVKLDGVEINDERRKNIDQRTKVELADYFVVGVDKDVNHLTCGATVRLTIDRPDNKIVHGETSITFDIHKGEGGQLFTVPKGPLAQLVAGAE